MNLYDALAVAGLVSPFLAFAAYNLGSLAQHNRQVKDREEDARRKEQMDLHITLAGINNRLAALEVKTVERVTNQ